MKSSRSLPSLYSEPKLFQNKHDLENAKKQFLSRAGLENQKSSTQEKKMPRSMIQFVQDQEGFHSFKNINATRINEILVSLKDMKSKSTTINRTLKAEILFNKQQYKRITDYCDGKKTYEKQDILNKLAKLEPLKMKKEIKKTQKFKKKTRTTIGIKLQINYLVFEQNRICWKPYLDFDSMSVCIGNKVYFIGGRQSVPLCYYDRSQNKWFQERIIENLKTFGETEATVLSDDQFVFFGGSRFYNVGMSEPTNHLNFINLKTMSAKIQTFEENKISSRSFHSQCLYGQYLIVSGGVDKSNKLINNFMAYSLTKKYWCELTIAKIPVHLISGFAKHKMVPVIHQRKLYHIYDDETITSSLEEQKMIKEEGIYIFGGEDSNVDLSNKLYILKLGAPSIVIYEPAIKGQPPLPRKNFAIVRIKQFLFIHGGRNDEMKPFVLNSIHILNLKIMEWTKIQGQYPSYRHSHAMLNYNNSEIVILGGKNQEGLCKQIYPMAFDEMIQYI